MPSFKSAGRELTKDERREFIVDENAPGPCERYREATRTHKRISYERRATGYYVHDYLPYRLPEVWLFRNQELLVYQLQGSEYVVQTSSRFFPDTNLPEIMAQCVRVAYERNTSTAMRELK